MYLTRLTQVLPHHVMSLYTNYPSAHYVLIYLMTDVPLVNWNVLGLYDPLKRVMVSSILNKYHPAIIGLQEIHLTQESLSCLKYSWDQKVYHSTHTSYSRGVCVLIHKSLDLKELAVLSDPEGRYVFLFCKLFTLTCII